MCVAAGALNTLVVRPSYRQVLSGSGVGRIGRTVKGGSRPGNRADVGSKAEAGPQVTAGSWVGTSVNEEGISRVQEGKGSSKLLSLLYHLLHFIK